jgi:hypothetical protein
MALELQSELEIYEREKERLIAAGDQGKFAVIGDGALAGVFDTYEDALKVGYNRFGLETRFLVKKVEAVEGVLYFTRDIGTCRA